MAYEIICSMLRNWWQFENFQITGCHCSNFKAVQDEGAALIELFRFWVESASANSCDHFCCCLLQAVEKRKGRRKGIFFK
jgi:hypothetical protein